MVSTFTTKKQLIILILANRQGWFISRWSYSAAWVAASVIIVDYYALGRCPTTCSLLGDCIFSVPHPSIECSILFNLPYVEMVRWRGCSHLSSDHPHSYLLRTKGPNPNPTSSQENLLSVIPEVPRSRPSHHFIQYLSLLDHHSHLPKSQDRNTTPEQHFPEI